jgi:hypothetical protein
MMGAGGVSMRRVFPLLAATAALALAGLALAGPAADTSAPRPIDFAKIDRTIAKLPELTARVPRYGLFLFGLHGEKRVWAVLDKSKPDAEQYDVLFLDRNADGDLTAADERIAGTVAKGYDGMESKFAIGNFTDPATGAVHTNFTLTNRAKSVFYDMRWRGEKVTMGLFGPTGDTYQPFGDSAENALVIVPGWDRPFEFEHWMSGTLERGKDTDFKVFLGNRGSKRGGFSCVDDKFLPKAEHVLATLLYTDGRGKQQRVQAKLTSRC